jgi:hypothetical protein
MNTAVLHLEFLAPVPPECEQFFGEQGAVRLNSVSYLAESLIEQSGQVMGSSGVIL